MPTYSNKKYIDIFRPIPDNWPTDIFGIPFIKKTDIDISNLNNGKWLIGINNICKKDKNMSKKIVHAFKYDSELERFYKKPYFFLERVSGYYATATLDFSMDVKMKPAQIINATFKNRWIGMWLQLHGYEKVAVTVGWVDKDTYDICFAGIEDGTLLIISTLGIIQEGDYALFINGYKEMRRRFPKSRIICIGKKLNDMDEDVCYVPYKDTFGTKDKYCRVWQPHFLNWELKEVDE